MSSKNFINYGYYNEILISLFIIKMKGGNVIGEGSYGCVFDPALLCEGEKERPKGFITKMLDIRNFNQEWKAIQEADEVIKLIPNNENYFIVNQVKPCINPIYDDSIDLSNFSDKTCNALTKKKFPSIPGEVVSVSTQINRLKAATKSNIFQGLSMPNGGPDVNKYTKPEKFSPEHLISLNNTLIDLILNGVIPMNKAGLLHLDAKAANIVYDGRFARLIDWGLAAKVNPRTISGIDKDISPTIMVNRPFTNILFIRKGRNLVLVDYINHNILPRLSGATKDEMAIDFKKKLRSTILQSVDVMRRNLNSKINGHLSYIADVAYRGNVDEVLDVIAIQIAYAVLEQCLSDDLRMIDYFNLAKYVEDVYRHNVDVYGVITCYLTLITNSHKDIVRTTKIASALDTNVITKYLYSDKCAATAYNINELIADLQSLNSNSVLYPNSTKDLPTEIAVPPAPQNTPAAGGKRRKSKKSKTNKKNKTRKRKSRK
jgi:hypothetical protein